MWQWTPSKVLWTLSFLLGVGTHSKRPFYWMGAFELWSGIMLKQLIGALSIHSWKVLIVAITRLGLCYYPKKKKKFNCHKPIGRLYCSVWWWKACQCRYKVDTNYCLYLCVRACVIYWCFHVCPNSQLYALSFALRGHFPFTHGIGK